MTECPPIDCPECGKTGVETQRGLLTNQLFVKSHLDRRNHGVCPTSGGPALRSWLTAGPASPSAQPAVKPSAPAAPEVLQQDKPGFRFNSQESSWDSL